MQCPSNTFSGACVDLDRSRSVSTYVYQDFKKCHIPIDLAGCFNTLFISRMDCPFKVRFVFAYSVDNSDKPSYLLWPHRGAGGQFLLVDPWSGNYFDLAAAKLMAPKFLPRLLVDRLLEGSSRTFAGIEGMRCHLGLHSGTRSSGILRVVDMHTTNACTIFETTDYALRGDTKHFQPNMSGKIVLRYLEGMDELLINGIQAIL